MGQMEGMEVVVMEVEDEEERESGSQELKWEKFLPRMVLRVLLVEADDSTRQIIGSYLRKYNYKVAAISDGLKAWEILKKRHHNIDLILTELDLPSISGYALLTLIMEHDSCKDIPVIMMSSQDSISTVLKCILKGAADFLIKPVRKNELKNLWRHVWRRLDNNAGHNPQNLTAGQQKTEATLENVSSSQKSSSFCEKAFDAKGLSHQEETGLGSREGKHQSKNVKVEEGLSLHTSVTEDKTDELGSFVQPSKEVNISTSLRVEEDGSCTGIATEDGSNGPENQTYSADIVRDELPKHSIEAVDLIGRINKQYSAAGKASFNGEFSGDNSTPELELSLKRPLDSETKEVQEKHVLHHSSASAFSRYSSNKRPRTTFPSSDVGLPKVKGAADPSPVPKTYSSNRGNKPEPDILVPQSAHRDPVSPCHQTGLTPLSGHAFDSSVWTNYGAVFQPMFSLPHTDQKARSSNSALQNEEAPFLTSPPLHSDPGAHSSTQGCGEPKVEPVTKESVEQHGCSSSHVVDPSGSSTHCNDFGSQHKINAHGSASEITDVKAPASGMKGPSSVEESENCKPVEHQLRKTMGIHSAEREAALAKFRQKRKGRCYEKKVRYQSRKRLAEQRPRVKGQFVRQVANDQVLADDKA
ncbi:two-component response regulator-like APRR9 [Beta vulgaris subsp. vulgaris]|uniref:two-component response regulator-like APRR9 n=1 Tax=Beta vulgaris subsp. vulgaris TaxID=3555 RepID=UPI002036A0F9|nr:two-component response regulator-like APRR9 [Beta vulgaris subsp. vulgaris]